MSAAQRIAARAVTRRGEASPASAGTRAPTVILGVGLLIFLLAPALHAQDPLPIQDNSFLIEEAYNQERGVVQHISTFERAEGGDAWAYTFTQEWPFRGIRHQLSYAVPVLQDDSNGTGIGDVMLNYRYQALGGPDARVVFAPRASLLLPTGSDTQGRGSGALGFQANLPLSVIPHPRLATHWNAGLTQVRSATTVNLGASAIWLLRPSFNLVLEALWLGEEGEDSAFLNPGVRWAFNFPSGLQIVPGVAYTIGIGPSRGDDALFVYLSFEHSFKR